MAQGIRKKLQLAAVETAAGVGAFASAAGDHPVIAAGCVAAGAGFLLTSRSRLCWRPGRSGEGLRADSSASQHGTDVRNAFLAVLQDRIDTASSALRPPALVIVSPRFPADATPSVRAAWVEHVGSGIHRVTRESDHWAPLEDGRFVVLLSECDELQAAAYGDRLGVAIANRPLLADGVRVVVDVVAIPSVFHASRFAGAADFLAAAERRAAHLVFPIHRLVADTRLLRRRLVSDDYSARAA